MPAHWQFTEILGKAGVPVGPVLSTKEILIDPSLYDGNTLVNINQGGKVGEFVTEGCLILGGGVKIMG